MSNRIPQEPNGELYSKDSHQRVLQILSSMHQVDYIEENYDSNRIIVYTKYGTTDIVEDVCQYFSLSICKVSITDSPPPAENNEEYFKIELGHNGFYPSMTTKSKFQPKCLSWVTEEDKI